MIYQVVPFPATVGDLT